MNEQIKNAQLISKLLDTIKAQKGIITPEELVVKSGYSKDEVLSSLNRLVEQYEARVNLNQTTGALQFIFKYPLFMRGKKTFFEKLATVISFIYKVFKQVYKAAVGIVLVAYTLIFAIILILLSTAGNSNNNSSNNRDSGFGLVSALFRAIAEAFFWNRAMRPIEYAYDSNGNRYRGYQKEKKKGPGFIKGVFSFVFGPEEPKFDPLSNAREVAAYIRLYSRGKLTSANIIELSGVNYPEAESRLAEYAAKFKGNLEISTDGVLYGDFDAMLGTPTAGEAKFIEFYKDEVEPPVELTGNSTGRNFLIVLLNAFNLTMATFLMTSDSIYYKDIDLTQFMFLSYFPFVISSLYFIIPLLRVPSFFIRKNNRTKRVLHKKTIGYICEQRKRDFVLPEFLHYLNIQSKDANTVKSLLEQIVIELEGELKIDENGQIIYVFERLYNELKMK